MANVPNFNPNIVSASPAALGAGDNPITYAGVAALTVAQPTVDGQIIECWDEGGHAHVVTFASVGSPPTQGLNGIHTTITFNGTAGSGFSVKARGNNWYVRYINGVTVS